MPTRRSFFGTIMTAIVVTQIKPVAPRPRVVVSASPHMTIHLPEPQKWDGKAITLRCDGTNWTKV